MIFTWQRHRYGPAEMGCYWTLCSQEGVMIAKVVHSKMQGYISCVHTSTYRHDTYGFKSPATARKAAWNEIDRLSLRLFDLDVIELSQAG